MMEYKESMPKKVVRSMKKKTLTDEQKMAIIRKAHAKLMGKS